MGCDNTLFAKMHKVSLTTIEHFVVFKGRDACDIIMKKILSQNSQYSEIQPISTYHVEYEPRLIVRGTTSYAKTKKGKNLLLTAGGTTKNFIFPSFFRNLAPV